MVFNDKDCNFVESRDKLCKKVTIGLIHMVSVQIPEVSYRLMSS